MFGKGKVKVKKPFFKRGWFIAIVAFVIIGAIGSGGDDKNAESDSNAQEEVVTIQRSDLTVNQYLAYMVNEVMGEKTNMDEDKLIRVDDAEEGSKYVTVRADENFTADMMVTGMLMDATKYFEKISKDSEVMQLKDISIFYEMTLVDKYGKEFKRNVHMISLSTETMKKINWDNFMSQDLPDVADSYFLHPVLKK